MPLLPAWTCAFLLLAMIVAVAWKDDDGTPV